MARETESESQCQGAETYCRAAVGFTQVLWSTEATGQLWNTCVWNLHSGTVEHTFKGGVSSANSLCLVGNEYLLSAESGKPLLHHWPICKKESKQVRIVVPGKVGVLKVSPDSNFCIASISERIHVWQLNSGRLLAILSAHYQPVRSLAFTSDGAYFLSAGDDAVIHCWSIASVVDQTCTVQTEPQWSSSNHSLPISDVFVAELGDKSRALSASLDQSCRIYDTATGKQIAVLMFDSGVSKVTLNSTQSSLYAGMLTGSIYKVNLNTRPVKTERHITGGSDDKTTSLFSGHVKEVTCICLNLDGSVLASGSKDMTVRLWHTSSGQCVRTLSHKGAITNLLITHYQHGLSLEKFQPRHAIKQLDRNLYISNDDREGIMELSIPFNSCQEEDDIIYSQTAARALSNMSSSEKQAFISGSDPPTRKAKDSNGAHLLSQLADTKKQLSQALAANKQLYQYRVTQIASKPDKDLTSKMKSKSANRRAR